MNEPLDSGNRERDDDSINDDPFDDVSTENEGKPVSFWVSIVLGFLLVVSAGLNLLLILVAISAAGQFGMPRQDDGYQEVNLQGDGPNKILVIPIDGMITDQGSSGLFGAGLSPVERVRRQLERAADDDSVKGVILKVNSPGGGVTASDKIYHHIQKFKKERPNVFFLSLMENVAASGGYYVSAPAEHIMAHPTTITGSIGVIMQFFVVQGLLKKLEIDPVTVIPDQAENKDLGSPLKPFTEEDRKIFKGVVTRMYERFVDVTAEGRDNLSREQVVKLADGRIYHARQAVENGLIDSTGYFEDAVEKVKSEQNLDQANVIRYKERVSLFDSLQATARSASDQRALSPQIRQVLLGKSPPKLLYLWSPKQKMRVQPR